MFQKVVSGNPAGRPVGAKDRATIDARRLRREMIESWDRVDGPAKLDALAESHPDRWAALLVSLLPKQTELDARDVSRTPTPELLAQVLPQIKGTELGKQIIAGLLADDDEGGADD